MYFIRGQLFPLPYTLPKSAFEAFRYCRVSALFADLNFVIKTCERCVTLKSGPFKIDLHIMLSIL
jgi:hypothetical protein